MTLEIIIIILLLLFIVLCLIYIGKTLIEIEKKNHESDR